MKILQTNLFIPLKNTGVYQNDKAPLINFSATSNYQTAKLQSPNVGLIMKDLVLVDIDDAGWADVAFRYVQENGIKCLVNHTSKGKHFIFKKTKHVSMKNGNAVPLAGSFRADIKQGATAMAVIDIHGSFRPDAAYDYGLDELQSVPLFFQTLTKTMNGPSTKEISDNTVNLFRDGSRNDTFKRWTSVLFMNGYKSAEVEQICDNINTLINLKPYTTQEFKKDIVSNQIKPEFEQEAFFDGKVFNVNAFTEHFVETHYVVRYDGVVYVRDGYNFTSNEQIIEGLMDEILPTLKANQRKEVYKVLQVRRAINTKTHKDVKNNVFACRNGLYEITPNGVIRLDDTTDIFVPFMLDVEYNPNVQFNQDANDALMGVANGSDIIAKQILEVMGLSFIPYRNLQKAFLLWGNGANGKSTITSVIDQITNGYNTSVKLHSLQKAFHASSIVGKLVNIGDDIDAKYIEDTGDIKSIISCESMTFDKKYSNVYQSTPFALHIFNTNHLPNSADKSKGWKRRWAIIPLLRTFDEDDPNTDKGLKYRIRDSKEAKEYLFKLAIDAVANVINTEKLTISDETKKLTKEYITMLDPMDAFLEHKTRAAVLTLTAWELSGEVISWAEDEGLDHRTRNFTAAAFNKAIKEKWGLKHTATARSMNIGVDKTGKILKQRVNTYKYEEPV